MGSYVATRATIVVTDGTSVAQLHALGAIGGAVYTNETDMPSPSAPGAVQVDTTPPTGAASVTWGGWLRSPREEQEPGIGRVAEAPTSFGSWVAGVRRRFEARGARLTPVRPPSRLDDR